MKLSFSKMHGCGNDFVVVDARKLGDHSWPEVAEKVLDRRQGIGADSLLVIDESKTADARMRVFERDGFESEMCGNGIRCVARYLRERDGNRSDVLSFETKAGPIKTHFESVDRIRVDMGAPIFEPQEIPVASKERIWNHELDVKGKSFRIFTISMGNPHAVIFLEKESDLFGFEAFGPTMENHELFPNRTNTEFLYVVNPNHIKIRVWERAAGATAACGTGACAAAVVAISEGRAKGPVRMEFASGSVEISWKKGENVFMTGPAAWVFDGEIEL